MGGWNWRRFRAAFPVSEYYLTRGRNIRVSLSYLLRRAHMKTSRQVRKVAWLSTSLAALALLLANGPAMEQQPAWPERGQLPGLS